MFGVDALWFMMEPDGPNLRWLAYHSLYILALKFNLINLVGISSCVRCREAFSVPTQLMIWNGLTSIVVCHSMFDLPILKHCAGQPFGVAQAGVEMSHLVIIDVHVLVPG